LRFTTAEPAPLAQPRCRFRRAPSRRNPRLSLSPAAAFAARPRGRAWRRRHAHARAWCARACSL
jgi:hypothetical protein